MEVVRILASGILTTLLALLGAAGGYVLGILQNRNERRNERRDEALAGIYWTMMMFYRGVLSWSTSPTSNPISQPDTSWENYCRERYQEFLDAYFGNSIWLGEGTDDLISKFAQEGRKIVNEFSRMNGHGQLEDGTSAQDRRDKLLSPIQLEVKKALRDEMERSRSILPVRVVFRKQAQN